MSPVDPAVRFKRFLYVGSEELVYSALTPPAPARGRAGGGVAADLLPDLPDDDDAPPPAWEVPAPWEAGPSQAEAGATAEEQEAADDARALAAAGQPLSLSELAAAGRGQEAVSALLACRKTRTACSRDPALEALARCFCNKKLTQLAKPAFQEFMGKQDSEDVLTFYHYFSKAKQAVLAKTGKGGRRDDKGNKLDQIGAKGGRCLRNLLNEWYNTADVVSLLEVKKKHYRHKDIFKLIHPKGKDLERKVLFTYLMFGYKKAGEILEKQGHDKAYTHMYYYKDLDELRRCKEGPRALELLMKKSQEFKYINPELYDFDPIWSYILLRMNLRDVLYHVRTVATRSMLKLENTPVSKVLIKVLNDKMPLKVAELQPVEVFIEYKKAKTNYRPPAISDENQLKKRSRMKTVKICQPVMDTIYRMIPLCYQNLSPLPKKVLLYAFGSTGLPCRKSHMLNYQEAAAMMVLSLVQAPQCQLTVVGAMKGQLAQDLDVDATHSLEQIQDRLKALDVELGTKAKPGDNIKLSLLNAIKSRLLKAESDADAYDALVVVLPKNKFFFDHEGTRFLADRSAGDSGQKRTSNTKYVKSQLCSTRARATQPASPEPYFSDPNVFHLCGFDANVPKLIAGYIMGEF